ASDWSSDVCSSDLVVALARNVRRDLHRVGEPHTSDLAQRRVRLLRRRRVDAGADTAPLRRGDLLLAALAGLQARCGQLLGLRIPALADQLRSRGHTARKASSGYAAASSPSASNRSAYGCPVASATGA